MSEGLTPGDPLGSPAPNQPHTQLPGVPGPYTSPPPPGAGGPAPVALAGTAIVSIFVFALVALLYAPIFMWRTDGRTIGRMAAGTRVVRANGQAMDFGTAMMREVVLKVLAVGIASSLIPLLPFLADVLWPLWDDENRALHDFPVNTRTVLD
jgi:uncharacterized RDD family membrane protein YckC